MQPKPQKTGHPPDSASSGSMGRLFLAVEIPEPTRSALERRLGDMLAGRSLPGRPVPPRNWHLTLRFLGDTPAPRLTALREALEGADLGGRFGVRFGAPGAFPRPARASVVWLGIDDGADPLARLAARAEAAARRVGFPPEDRPFRAHLTLSRVQPPRDLRRLLADFRPADRAMEVTELALFRSHLGGGPPRYEVIQRFALRGPDR